MLCPSVLLTVGHPSLPLTPLTLVAFSTGMEQGQLKQICDEAVARIREFSETLLRNIPQFVEIGDAPGAEIIQNSCIGCLAHLSVLCDFIGRLEPNSRSWMDIVCDWSLERLGTLTTGMDFEEYTYLDLLMKVGRSSTKMGIS